MHSPRIRAAIWAAQLAALYLRWSPITAGRWRVHARALPVIRSHGAEMGRRIVRTRYGFRFSCDLGDWLGQYVYLTGYYERMTSEIMAALIGPGDVALDVGANVGYFTVLLSARIGTGGTVYAFEPIPGVAQSLRRNIALNGLKNVQVVEAAVTDHSGSVRIFEGPADHKGVSSLRPLSNSSGELTVRTVSLDGEFGAIPTVRLIKIDVEGAEMLALKGMASLIARDHPYLVMEFSDAYLRNFDASVATLREFLTARGYSLYHVGEWGLAPLDMIDTSGEFQYNVLCAPEDNLPQRLRELVRG